MLDKTPGLKDLTEGKELVLRGLKKKDVLTEDPVPVPIRLEGMVKVVFRIIREVSSIDDQPPVSSHVILEGMVKVVFRIIREDLSIDDPISDLVGMTLEGALAED